MTYEAAVEIALLSGVPVVLFIIIFIVAGAFEKKYQKDLDYDRGDGEALEGKQDGDAKHIRK